MWKNESKMVIDNKTQQQIFSLYNIVDYNLFLSITFDLDFYSHIVPQILTLMFEIIFFLLENPEIEHNHLKSHLIK